jgi:hypothetical protein|tara:strand:- start:2496 stop:2729 length:234 start_codon:yes stop_codon:yes gene_type:complete
VSGFIFGFRDVLRVYPAKEEAVSAALQFNIPAYVKELVIYEVEEVGSLDRTHVIAAQTLVKEESNKDDNDDEPPSAA